MKRMMFILMGILFFINFNYAQKVGEIINGTPIFTVDKSKLIATYEDNLLEYGAIEADFLNVEIRNIENEYNLTFIGNNIKSSLFISNTNGDLIVDGKTSCTTSECSSENLGCSPRPLSGGCFPCNNNGNCSKTVTDGFSLIE